MSAEIVKFNGFTRFDISPEWILDGAKDQLKSVLLVGWDKDDKLYIASSTGKVGDLLELIEHFKKDLMENVT